MLDFAVQRVGVFRREETNDYVQTYPSVGLHARGLSWYRTLGTERRDVPPCLLLRPPGTRIEFRYGRGRENWVVQLEGDAMRAARGPDAVELRSGGAWLTVPATVFLDEAMLAHWRREFETMREAATAPDPKSRLRLACALAAAFAPFLDATRPAPARTPAGRLRELLDSADAPVYTLAELAHRCGLSADHLRLLFVREFGVTPAAYRRERRLARAMELAAGSRLAVKEIAEACGYRHVSHLSADFRARYGCPPSEAVRRYRHGRPR